MLDFQRPDSRQRLSEGLREYYASRENLIDGRGASEAARRFFRSHDVAHVVFGCNTTLASEAVVKLWSFFGTTAGLGLWRAYRLPESREVYGRLGLGEIAFTALHSLLITPIVLWRCTRMKKRWPWDAFEPYLDVPLRDIREEYGIRVVRRGGEA